MIMKEKCSVSPSCVFSEYLLQFNNGSKDNHEMATPNTPFLSMDLFSKIPAQEIL